jgi:glycosyltransferase involved in cell wall biosynthesis
VSIIIPVFNCEKYIEEALLSAIHQSYQETEIIVVNDGSNDGTIHVIMKVMEKYPDKIRLFSKKNEGTASALNAGIRQAQGMWIKWLSAVDVMYPNCLDLMMDKAKYKDTIYYSNYDIIDFRGAKIGEFIEPQGGHTPDYLWKRFFGNGSSSLIHRNVFSKCGLFDESIEHSEDYEFWLRATQIHGIKMELVPEKTIKYRRHADMLTNKVGGRLDDVIKEKIRAAKASSG